MKNNPSHEAPYSYWKYPWQKWIALAAAAVQLLCLWLNLSDYQSVSAVEDLIFSTAELAKWKAQRLFLCTVNGMAAVIFTGEFLIGALSRSGSAAKLAEGLLLLLVGLSGSIATCIIDFTPLGSLRALWLLTLALLFAVGAYTLWQSLSRKTEK